METIAERELVIDGLTGSVATMKVGRPMPEAGHGWTCSFQIVGLGDDVELKAGGEDSVQALLLGFEMARAYLNSLKTHRVSWMGMDPL